MKDHIDKKIDLEPGESVLWHNQVLTGLFHRRLLSYMAITNREIILINHPDADQAPLYYRLPLPDVSDVVVMNYRNFGTGVYTGYGTGKYWGRPYHGYAINSNVSIGDIVFMVHGQPRITFRGIADPDSVRNLALSVLRK
jgi:hypothetical protein